MSPKRMKFLNLILTLLLAIGIIGSVSPVLGQDQAGFQTGSRKTAVGGAATIDPATLPGFEFKYSLDFYPINDNANYRIVEIEDTKFDSRLFLQRMVIRGDYATKLQKIELRPVGGAYANQPFTITGNVINVGSATNAIDTDAAANVADQTVTYNNTGSVPDSHVNTSKYDRIRFTFKNEPGGNGSDFSQSTNGSIDLYFRVLKPYSSQLLNGTGTAVTCNAANPSDPVNPKLVCNYARFKGSYGSVDTATNGIFLVPTPTYQFHSATGSTILKTNVNDTGSASFNFLTTKMMSTNPYNGMTFTAILPQGYEYASSRVTNSNVQAQLQSVNVTNISGGKKKVVLKYNDFTHATVGNTQAQQFNFVINYVPTPSAPTSNQEITGYLSMTQYSDIQEIGSTGMYKLVKNGNTVATSIGMIGADSDDADGDGNMTEKIFKDTVKVQAIAPANELKGASYFDSTGYSRLKNVARGNTYTYRTELTAYGSPVSRGVVYEAFPDSGTGSNSRLNGQIPNPAPARYRIEYCTTPNMPADAVAGAADGACTSGWQTTLPDYSQATAYRIKVQNGQSIPIGTPDRFTVTMTANGRGYDSSEHNVWYSQDDGLNFNKTTGSALTVASMLRVKITSRWTKPSQTIPNPDTTATIAGAPPDLVVAGETGTVALNGSTLPNTDSSITETKDLTVFGVRSNLNIPLSYTITASAVLNWTSPAASGTCVINETANKNAADQSYDYHCYFDYEYPSPASVALTGTKNWDPNINLGRAGAFELSLQYRVRGSGQDWTNVPPALLLPSTNTVSNCNQSNPVDLTGTLNSEQFTWCVSKGPNATDEYEFRIYEKAKTPEALIKWKADGATPIYTGGTILEGYASGVMPISNGAGAASLSNVLNKKNHGDDDDPSTPGTNEDALKVKVSWYNGPAVKPDAYVSLLRIPLSGGKSCTVGATPEAVLVGGNPVRVKISDLTEGGWTTSNISGDVVAEKTYELTGMPKMNDFGCTYTYFIAETDAGGTDLTPAGYNKTVAGSGKNHSVVNRYNVPHIPVTGTKKWSGGGLLVRPTISMGLYIKETIGGVDYLLSPEHPNLSSRVPQPIYLSDCGIAGDPTTYEAAGIVAVADGTIPNNEDTVSWCVPQFYKDGVTPIVYYVDENLGNEFSNASPNAGAPAGPSGLNTGAVAPASYVKTYTNGNLEITNTYVPPTVNPDAGGNGSIEATVVWLPTGVTPGGDITLTLMRTVNQATDCTAVPTPGDCEAVATATLKVDYAATHQWKYKWVDTPGNNADDLPATDAYGRRYYYKVAGSDAPANFIKEASTGPNAALTATYRFQAPRTVVVGKKIWAGGPASKPNVRFTLQRSSDDGVSWEDVPNNEVFLDGAHAEPEFAKRAAITLAGGPTPDTEAKWYTTEKSPAGISYIFSVREATTTNYIPLYVDAGGNPVPEQTLQIENTYTPPTGDITLTKLWNGGPANRPNVTVTLMRSVDGTTWEKVPDDEINLPDATYAANPHTLTGGAAPVTEAKWHTPLRDRNGRQFQFTVTEASLDEYPNPTISVASGNNRAITVANTFKSKKTDIEGTKLWNGGSEIAMPASILLTLQRETGGGAFVTVDPAELTAPDASYAAANPATVAADGSGNWKVKWSVDEKDGAGVNYVYRVIEAPADVPSGWFIDMSTAGATTDRQITNRVKVENNQTVIGEKKWIGGPRVDISMVLWRILLNPDGTDRPGTKHMVPNGDDPQTVYIEHIENPYPLELADEGMHGWKKIWTNLPDRDTATGLKYRYFVDEAAVPAGYRKVKSQSDPTPITDNETLIVTNELIPVAGTVTGVKVWQGGRDKNREAVVLQLWRTPVGGGAAEMVSPMPGIVNPVTLNPDNVTGNPAHSWQHTWTGLDATNYTYEVREDASGLTNYMEIADANPNSVTNKYIVPLFDDPGTPGPDNGKVTGRVVWLNGGAEIDSASVQLQIYAQKIVLGNPVFVPIGAPITLNGADAATHHWQHEWTNLPGEDEATGEPYVAYVVDDVSAPAGFEQVDEGNPLLPIITDNRDLQVTYRKPQAAGTFTAKKVWSGGAPAAGCDVVLQLWQGDPDETTNAFMVTIDASNLPLANNPVTLTFAQAGTHHWEHTWTNLKALPAGTIYFVKEGSISGGCSFVEAPDSNPQTVTNAYQIATKAITVTKTWVNGRTKREEVILTLQRLPVGGAWENATVETDPGCAAAATVTVTPPGGVNNPSAPAGNQTETVTFCTKAGNASGAYQFRIVEREPAANLHNDLWSGAVTGDADSGFVVTNTFTPATQPLTITKIWGSVIAANPVTIKLQQATGVNPPDPDNAQNITLTDADFAGGGSGNLTRWEKIVTAPVTDDQGVAYTYTVAENSIPLCATSYPAALTVRNDCVPADRNLKLVINWVGGPVPHPAVTVHVRGHIGATDQDVPLTPAGMFENTLTLPANHSDGTLINYAVSVDMTQPGLADYDIEFLPAPPTVQLTADQEVRIKLTYRAPQNSVTANKVWVGGGTLSRPTIWFTLYQKVRGSINAPVPVPGAPTMVLNHGTTSVTWPNIPQVDASAQLLEFSVRETDAGGDVTFVPPSYTKVESGLTVTNTYQSTGTVSANKVWQSGSGPHPTIWFKLYRQLGSNPVEEVPPAQAPIIELTPGTLQADWNNVEVTDPDGRPYKFSVKEVDATGADWTPDGYIKIERDLTVVNTKRGLLTVAVNTDPATTMAFEINVTNANGDSTSARIDNDSSDPTNPDQMVVTDIPTVAHTVKITNLDLNIWEVTKIECTQKPLGSTNPLDEVPLPITPVHDFNGKLTGEFTIDTVPAEHALACVYDLRSLIGGRIIVNNETLANPAQPIFPTYEYRTDGAGYNSFTLAANSVIPDSQEVQPGTYQVAQANINGWVTMDVIVTSSIPGRKPFVNLVDQRIVGTVPPNGTGWESLLTFTLEPKETVTVKFVNAPSNTVMIRKETLPAGKPQKFEFRGPISGFIGDGEYLIQSGLVPDGTQWQITEQGYDEWKLTEVRCIERGVIGETPTRGDHGLASAFIGLDDGESIVCTFINRHETEPEEHYDPPVPGFTDFDTLPRTGFAPGRVTKLPDQPAAKLYQTSPMVLNVPGLNQSLEIFGIPRVDGNWDITWLGQHAGYLMETTYPTHEGNSVITAHVWDAYNNPGPFYGLKDMVYGDKFTIQFAGKTYVFEVRENEQILETDAAKMLAAKQGSWITLMTCESYDESADNYAYRRIVRGVLVDVQ